MLTIAVVRQELEGIVRELVATAEFDCFEGPAGMRKHLDALVGDLPAALQAQVL
jgi:hypothetical protein